MIRLGKTDTVTKNYMRDPVIFADAFNKFLYRGKQVIRPENLTEIDAAEIAVPYGEGGAGVPEQKYRDVLKLAMTDGNTAYCILGCEGQNDVHYAMPVRNITYDAIQLTRQVSEAAKSHRREKDRSGGRTERRLSAEEYLSGFYKTDRLLPVVTLVIFFGPEKWDGPLTLKEMYAPADEAVLKYAPDYRVNLIAPEQMTDDEISEFKTSLKEVMLYIKYSRDKDRLQKTVLAEPGFRNLDRQAAEVINAATNSKLKYPQGKGTIDVCAAIEEMKMDSRQEGWQEGRQEGRTEGEMKGAVETYMEFQLPLQEAVRRIAEKFSISLEQAGKEVNKYWKS